MCTKDTIRCTKTHDYTPIQSCCKEHLVELLKFVTDVLENNKIKYWLDYGTLLGAVREGGQIAWDDDCDISILLEDEEKVRTILTNNSYGYELYDNPLINEGSSFLGLRYSSINRCHIDIFAWYREGNLMKRRNYLDEGPISPDAKKGKHFPFSFIETLIPVKFENINYWAPNNPVEFCKMRYGKAWNVPMTVADWNSKVNTETNQIYEFND